MTLSKEVILSKILKDREQRFALRQAMVGRGLSSISLNFNIPGYPKSSETIRKAFDLAQADLCRYFTAHRIHMVEEAQEALHSDSGDFFLQAVSYMHRDEEVKEYLENFEMSHPLGRLLDVDLMNNKGNLISSGKEKPCFLCNAPAKECMKKGEHSYSDYESYIVCQIEAYLSNHKKKTVLAKITERALKATLFEVALGDKPGLVCPESNGAHTDMDYFTFLASSASLGTYWQEFARLGYEKGQEGAEGLCYKELRVRLRVVGLEAEEAMFSATDRVNTQKGIIFLMGLGCFASGFVFAKQDTFSVEIFRTCVQNVMQGIVTEDFDKGYSKQGTHGEKAFKNYGKKLAGGARHEAEEGFPSVFNYALEYLNLQLHEGDSSLNKQDWQEVLSNLLMLIISKSNDVNILYRKNEAILRQVQCRAARVLATSSEDRKNKELREFADYCMLHNISPGGAADLLALTLFVYFIQNLEF